MSPVGGLVPFLSAKRLKDDLFIVYQNLGGAERLLHEANRDPESYKWFMGLVAKLIPREVAVQHDVGANLESLIEARDRADKAQVIDGDFTEVPDAAD